MFLENLSETRVNMFSFVTFVTFVPFVVEAEKNAGSFGLSPIALRVYTAEIQLR